MKTYHRQSIPYWILASAALFLLVPFAGKAFHMDDPLFVWTARQVLQHPFDFYGFSVNWNGLYEPAHRIIQNPPLNGYLIAPVLAVFGESELAVHAWLALAAVAAVLGTARLARQVDASPGWSALFAATVPAFWISATGAMAEMPLLAFYTWALALWMEALEQDRPGKALCAGGVAALACLTKYFGITLVPLMAAYALLAGKFRPRQLTGLLIPLAAVAGYQAITQALYGRALFFDAARYTLGFAADGGSPVGSTLQGLAFVGGGLAGLICLAPLIHRPLRLAAGAGAAFAAILALHLLVPADAVGIPGLAALPAATRLQFWGLAMAGAYLMVLIAVEAYRRRREAAAPTLLLLVYGTFFFTAYLNWTTNARAVLPMTPAAAALIVGRIGVVGDRLERRSAALAIALATVILAVFPFCLADQSLANIQRQAAAGLHGRLGSHSGTVWFQGHWGFQYYMEAAGARPLNYEGTVIQAGDIVVVPGNNTLTTPLPPDAYHLAATVDYDPFPWAATMKSPLGAGFYASVWGPLPLAVGPVPPERFAVYLAGRFDRPKEALAPLIRRFSEPGK